jgi:hypothetical protein
MLLAELRQHEGQTQQQASGVAGRFAAVFVEDGEPGRYADQHAEPAGGVAGGRLELIAHMPKGEVRIT